MTYDLSTADGRLRLRTDLVHSVTPHILAAMNVPPDHASLPMVESILRLMCVEYHERLRLYLSAPSSKPLPPAEEIWGA